MKGDASNTVENISNKMPLDLRQDTTRNQSIEDGEGHEPSENIPPEMASFGPHGHHNIMGGQGIESGGSVSLVLSQYTGSC